MCIRDRDTLAKLMMNFAVEDNSNPTSPNPPTFTTTTSKVKTGDIWSIAVSYTHLDVYKRQYNRRNL